MLRCTYHSICKNVLSRHLCLGLELVSVLLAFDSSSSAHAEGIEVTTAAVVEAADDGIAAQICI